MAQWRHAGCPASHELAKPAASVARAAGCGRTTTVGAAIAEDGGNRDRPLGAATRFSHRRDGPDCATVHRKREAVRPAMRPHVRYPRSSRLARLRRGDARQGQLGRASLRAGGEARLHAAQQRQTHRGSLGRLPRACARVPRAVRSARAPRGRVLLPQPINASETGWRVLPTVVCARGEL